MPGSVILSGARTPIGKLSGALAGFSAMELGGFAVAAAVDDVAHPRCAEVAAGTATLPADGACYHGSMFRQYGTLVAVSLGAAGVGFALLLSGVLLFTGRRGRLSLAALAAGVVFLLIGALITHA